MRFAAAVVTLVCTAAVAQIREVKPPLHLLPPHDEPQTLAQRIEQRARAAAMRERGLAMRELAAAAGATNSTTSAGISNDIPRIRERVMMLHGLGQIVDDTRRHMPETAALGDAEVAALYVAQMGKRAADLMDAAHTNTVDRVIGAGMRQDLEGRANGRR